MTEPKAFTDCRLKWGFQVGRYKRYPDMHDKIIIPTMVYYQPRWKSTYDVAIPRDFAQHLVRELTRILAEKHERLD